MRILFRFLFKNIMEKKLRSLLIILAVAITTAMTFASFGTSDNFERLVIEKNKMEFGSADLLIKNNDDAPSRFLDKNKIEDSIKVENKVGIFNGVGLFKDNGSSIKTNIIASNIKDLQNINPIILSSESKGFNLDDLNGNQVIISKKFSEEFNIKLRDEFEIKTEGKFIKLKVEAIAMPKGFFSEKPGEVTLVLDNQGFSKLLDRDEEVTSHLIEGKDKKDEFKKIIKSDVKDATVLETMNDEVLRETLNQFTIPFYVMLAVVMLMAAFIVYSSFKIIVIERMSVIGTFRSIGATKFSTDGFLILESLIYGVIGCALGGVFGVPMLYILSDTSNQFKQYGMSTTIEISHQNMIIAFIVAILMCLISSIIPIIEVSKIPIKQIVLGEYSKNNRQHPSLWIIGIILAITPFYYIGVFPNSGRFILTVLCAFFLLIGVAIMIPLGLFIMSKILKPIYRFIFGNVGVLALENVATSKSLINNGVLLCCALAAVTAIFVASFSVKNVITKSFDGANYEVAISGLNKSNEEDIYKKLEKLKEKDIKGYYKDYLDYNIDILGKDMKIGILQGVDNENYLRYFSGESIINGTDDSSNQIIDKLKEGRYIILADLFEKKYKYKVGDEIKLKLNDKEYTYKVTGFLSSPISANKRNCLIGVNSFKEDLNKSIPNEILIKGNNLSEEELSSLLNNELEDFGVTIKEKEDIKKVEIENNAGIMNSLESFSIMALLIGALGIMNNLMVSFIQRKKELAVLSSVGMSKFQRMKMIIIEGFTIGVLGSVLGILTGVGVTKFVPEITLSLDTYLKISIPKEQLTWLMLLGVVLMIISSFVPTIKSSKISVVKEIKYE